MYYNETLYPHDSSDKIVPAWLLRTEMYKRANDVLLLCCSDLIRRIAAGDQN